METRISIKLRNSTALIVTATALFAVVVASALSVLTVPKYYLNLSSSEPIGLYEIMPFDERLSVGEMLLFDAPDQAKPYIYGREWLPHGWPLLKHVAAVTGNEFCITDAAIYVGGTYVGPIMEQDGAGRSMPKVRGCFTVQLDQFLPLATNIPNSFDGRYFGAVSTELIRGKVRPVLVF